MRSILNKIPTWNTALTVCLLALFGAPIGQAAAQTNEALISAPATNSTSLQVARPNHQQSVGNAPHDVVVIWRNSVLSADETADNMVVIGGSATALGKVRGNVVAILGNVTASNDVAGNTVAVLGNVNVGTNVAVRGDTVAVLGNVNLGANSKIHGQVVSVGGAVERGEGSTVKGQVIGIPGFKWVGEWLEQCVFKFRPLAPQLGWLWAITGVTLLIYLLIAIAFPRPIQACVQEITRRPVTAVLTGLLTKILVPFVLLILVATGVGVFVVPFLLITLMCGGIIGKVAVLQYLGQQIGRQSNLAAIQKPLLAFLLGWVIVTLLYLVPVLGFIVYALIGMWAIGAVILALFSGRRREAPENVPMPSPGTGSAPAHGLPATLAAAVPVPMSEIPPINPAGAPTGTIEPPNVPPLPPLAAAPAAQTTATGATVTPPPAHELLSCPKAGLWERTGAAFLDIVVVGVITGLVHGPLGFLLVFVSGPPVFFIIALAYFAGMWTWKGTSIGGIVLKLQVVRCDGQPLSFAVALVRGLAAALSVIVFLLGFLWIAWDREKQAWHDKIAGTIVVRVPRSIPLVLL